MFQSIDSTKLDIDQKQVAIENIMKKFKIEHDFKKWVRLNDRYHHFPISYPTPSIPTFPKNKRFTDYEIKTLKYDYDIRVVVTYKNKTFLCEVLERVCECTQCIYGYCHLHMKKIEIKRAAVKINHGLACDRFKMENGETECEICAQLDSDTCTAVQLFNHLYNHLHWARKPFRGETFGEKITEEKAIEFFEKSTSWRDIARPMGMGMGIKVKGFIDEFAHLSDFEFRENPKIENNMAVDEAELRIEYEFNCWMKKLSYIYECNHNRNHRDMEYEREQPKISTIPQIPENHKLTPNELYYLEKCGNCVVVVREGLKVYYNATNFLKQCIDCRELKCEKHLTKICEVQQTDCVNTVPE